MSVVYLKLVNNFSAYIQRRTILQRWLYQLGCLNCPDGKVCSQVIALWDLFISPW